MPGVVDVGLQHERTALAWERTGLGVLVVGAFLLRGTGRPLDAALTAIGSGALLLGVGLLALAALAYRRRQGVVSDPFEASARRPPLSDGHRLQPRLVRVTGLSIVGLCTLALAAMAMDMLWRGIASVGAV